MSNVSTEDNEKERWSQKRFTELGREEKDEGGNRGDLGGEEGELKGGESNQVSNHTPK